jgi:hypothetical protein
MKFLYNEFMLFIPFINRFLYKSNRMIKSLSGLLQNIIYRPKEPNSIIEMDCHISLDSDDIEKCKMIIPGYMDYEFSKEKSL